MRTVNAKDAKYNFGRLSDSAGAEPVAAVQCGRAVVEVSDVEEDERLKALDETVAALARTKKAKE